MIALDFAIVADCLVSGINVETRCEFGFAFCANWGDGGFGLLGVLDETFGFEDCWQFGEEVGEKRLYQLFVLKDDRKLLSFG